MGTGTEVTIQSAGVTFVKGNLAGILLSPGVAALAMSLSSVSVIGNALCLRTARP